MSGSHGSVAEAAPPAGVPAFFARYAAAFEAFDGDAVAALFATPCGLLDQHGYTHWAAPTEVAGNMRALCAIYRQRRLSAARPALRRWLPQARFAGYADVHWTLHWQAGPTTDRTPPCTTFGTGYLLRSTPDGWRIQLCTAYEETL